MDNFHFYDRDLETSDHDRLREIQERKLVELIAKLGSNAFYQDKAKSAGLKLSDIHTIEDLKALPFTTKPELATDQESHPPFGRLLSFPFSEYRYFHQTSGTTGTPLKWLDTEESWDCWRRCWGAVYRAAGVTSDDIVYCAFSFGPYISHWTAISGAWHVGALCLSGGGLNSEQRIRSIIDNRATVLVCTPTYALHLAEVARERGIDLNSSSLRISIHAGEPGASVPNVRRLIEESLGTTCFDHAGATEVGAWAFDCGAGGGAIHLNELEFVFEVVNSETGEPVSKGNRGELVISNLCRPGMPVLRYKTGDLVEMTTEPCICGRSTARIKGGVLGRCDDMLIVRGVNLYPGMLDNLIREVPDVVEYEVEIRRVMGLDDLLIKLETVDNSTSDDVLAAVANAFRTHLNIRVSVEHCVRGSLPRYEFKARRYKRIVPP